MQERGQSLIDEEGLKTVILVSDVTWFLSILPWGTILILYLMRDWWPVGFPYVVVPIYGIAVATIYAITNLAAMENLQRQFVAMIRKL